jgi:hypothetical protein
MVILENQGVLLILINRFSFTVQSKEFLMHNFVFILILSVILLSALSVDAGEILLNPDFEEDNDSNPGFPDYWIRQRLAVIDHDPLNAFDGDVSVKVSAWHAMIQEIPVIGGSRLFFSGFTEGDTGSEYSYFAAGFKTDNGSIYAPRKLMPATTFYDASGASFLAPKNAKFFIAVFKSISSFEWIRADIFSLLDEFIHNQDFEILDNEIPSGWMLSGSPEVNPGGQTSFKGSVEVLCEESDYFFQDLAVFPDKKYHLTFHARTGDASITPEAIPISFFNTELNPVNEILLEFIAEQEYKEFSFTFTPPENSSMMRISLRPVNGTKTPLWFDGLNLFAILSSPVDFSPNSDGIYDSSSVTFLTGSDVAVSINVLDENDKIIRKITSTKIIGKGVHSFPWDGKTDEDIITSPGLYRYSLNARNPYTEKAILETTVKVNNLPPLEENTRDFSKIFPRGLWLHLGGRWTENIDYKSHLSDIADFGFDTIIPNHQPQDRIDELMNAADENDLSVITYTQDINEQIIRYPDWHYTRIPETEIRDACTSVILKYASYPSLLGYYVSDEVRNEYLENAKKSIKVLNSMDPEHSSFSSIAATSDIEQKFDLLDTQVLMHHYYPIRFAKPVKPELFDAMEADLQTASGAALKKNRPLWIILQGFRDESRRRLPTAEEARCQVWLALSYNAKGIFYFLAESVSYLHGLFDYDAKPYPYMYILKEINHDLEKLTPVLLDIQPAENFAETPEHHTVKCFKDSGNVPHLIIVNRDCLSTLTVELKIELEDISKITDVLDNSTFDFYKEAGKTYILIRMSPGSGRLIRFESGRMSISSAEKRTPREAIFSALSIPGMPDTETVNFEQADDSFIVSFVPFDYLPGGIHVSDGKAFIAARGEGLNVIDVSKPWHPVELTTLKDLHYYENIFYDGNFSYTSDSHGGMVVHKINDEGKLEEAGSWWGNTGNPLSLTIRNNRAFLASEYYGLTVLDISDPTSITLIGRSEKCEKARRILLYDKTNPQDNTVYVLDEHHGIRVEDISTSSPVRINTIDVYSPFSGDISNNLMALSCGPYGVKLFSLDDPENPEDAGTIDLEHTDSLAFYRKEWIFASAGIKGIALIHIDENGTMEFEKFIQPFPGYYAKDIFIDDPYLYVLYPYKGMYIFSPDRIINPGAGKNQSGVFFY